MILRKPNQWSFKKKQLWNGKECPGGLCRKLNRDFGGGKVRGFGGKHRTKSECWSNWTEISHLEVACQTLQNSKIQEKSKNVHAAPLLSKLQCVISNHFRQSSGVSTPLSLVAFRSAQSNLASFLPPSFGKLPSANWASTTEGGRPEGGGQLRVFMIVECSAEAHFPDGTEIGLITPQKWHFFSIFSIEKTHSCGNFSVVLTENRGQLLGGGVRSSWPPAYLWPQPKNLWWGQLVGTSWTSWNSWARTSGWLETLQKNGIFFQSAKKYNYKENPN